MVKHISSYWSAYLAVIAILGPYAPFINGAINQFVAGHPQITTSLLALTTLIAHWLPAPAGTSPALGERR